MPPHDQPLRIWQICESYPPKYGGGAGVIAKDITDALAARGHAMRVLTTESRPDPEYSIRTERANRVAIDRVNLPYLVEKDPDGWQLGLRAWRRHERRIVALLDEQISVWCPDIVQYHTTRPFGEAGPLAIASRGVPVVSMLHEAWFLCGRLMLLRSPTGTPCEGPAPIKCLECMYSHDDGSHARAVAKLTWRIPRLGVYPAYRLWRRRTARQALAGEVGYSHFMLDVHEPHVRNAPTFVPMGINLDGLPSTLPARPRRPLRFGFLAGFQPHKGIRHVLEAAEALKHDGLEFEIHVWGPSGSGSAVELAKWDLTDRVQIHGMYEAREMWDVYCQFDVAVMATTVTEAFGRIPLEARAVGAPTIAPEIGGLPESIRHDVDGLLYRFNDPHDLERQMRRTLTEPGLFERLAANLQPVIDTRTRGAELEAVYRSVLDEAEATVAA